MSEEYRPDNDHYSRPRAITACGKKPDSDGYWICHRCGSMWSEMVSGLGWLPLSCHDRHAHPLQDRGQP